MRECPLWFQDELLRIGGTNPYGEPIFRLAWSTDEKMVIGGRWQRDGYEGYKEVPSVPGVPCWALMMWEPRDVFGSLEMWELDYRDPETNYLQCVYPKYGRYRMLKRFIHQEIVSKPTYTQEWVNGILETKQHGTREIVTYRMEPCGFILDLLLPMLRVWLSMSNQAKVKALQEEEQRKKDDYLAKIKDARDGCRISRGSQLVAKRAEIIERGFAQAMAMAAQTGLGMRIGA